MANGHGGARTPSAPAPVSGPGAMSRRTDGGPSKPAYVSGLPYGEGQEFQDVQTAAPMGNAPANPRPSAGRNAPQGAAVVPFNAPTQHPDEPVTAGANWGPGPGQEGLASSMPGPTEIGLIQKYLPSLQAAAAMQDSPPSFRAFVRWLQGQPK